MAERIPTHKLQNTVATICLMLIAGLLMPRVVTAQSIIQDRQYEYTIVSPVNLAEFSGGSSAVGELFLYAYRNGAWEQIPHQIDERVGGDFFSPDDGLLDDDDQVAFMLFDLGEQVGEDNWPADASARSNLRYEISIIDPVTGAVGYVYLHRSQTLMTNPSLPTYMSYAAAPPGRGVADTVKGLSYIQGHLDANGIPNKIAIRSAYGGSESDLLDRLKLRVRAEITIVVPVTINVSEDNMSAGPGNIRLVQGAVRIIRRVLVSISVSGQTFNDVPLDLFFYPFSEQVSGNLALPSQVSTKLVRASFDFNANVKSGYAWFNQNSGPRLITGSSGGLNAAAAQVVFLPQRNWFGLLGTHGSIVGIFGLDPAPGAENHQFYFWDNVDGTADGTNDTGDGDSVADAGFMITSGGSIQGPFSIGMTVFMLGPNATAQDAANLARNTEQPVGQTFNLQEFRLAPVTDLQITNSNATSVTLQWTAPSDGGSAAASYELGYSMTPVGSDTMAWYDTVAVKTTNFPAPNPPSTTESATIDNLATGASYNFILRYADAFGNFSALSNVAHITAVPVELASFTAIADRNRTLLNWATASETNNLGFYVQRRAESIGEWTDLGFVRGHGTTANTQRYAFTDEELQPGRYRYRLRQVDFDGTFEYSPEIKVTVSLPNRFTLAQNYPNPLSLAANANTSIRFELANLEPVTVSLRIYNVLGREIRELVSENRVGGFYTAQWDGFLTNGERAPAGIYFYELRAGDQRAIKKLTLVR